VQRLSEPVVCRPGASTAAIDRSGTYFDMRSLAGRPFLLAYILTTCGPCKDEMDAIRQAEVDFPLIVISPENRDIVARFLAQLETEPTATLEDPGSTLASTYDVRVMPTIFVVDGTGRITLRLEGWSSGRWAAFLEAVASLKDSGGG